MKHFPSYKSESEKVFNGFWAMYLTILFIGLSAIVYLVRDNISIHLFENAIKP